MQTAPLYLFTPVYRGGLDFYGQMSEMIEKRLPILSTVCQGEKDRLRKIVGKAGQLKSTIFILTVCWLNPYCQC